jgi:hypothetical protein
VERVTGHTAQIAVGVVCWGFAVATVAIGSWLVACGLATVGTGVLLSTSLKR